MSEYHCKTATDWYKAGTVSASSGNTSDLSELQKTCPAKMTQENSKAYLRGYNDQLIKYCTTDHFLSLGKIDLIGNAKICPIEMAPVLAKANDKGLKIYKLGWELKSIQSKLESDSIADERRAELETRSEEAEAELESLLK